MTKKKSQIQEYSPSESQIAKSFVDFIKKKYPLLVLDLIKIDNENKCSPAEGARKKAEGKRKGACDYFFARMTYENVFDEKKELKTNVYGGLWIELKTKKGRLTKEQKEFAQKVIEHGYKYALCRSIDDVIVAFEDYIK